MRRGDRGAGRQRVLPKVLPEKLASRADSRVDPFLTSGTKAYFVWRFGRMVASHEFTLVVDSFQLAGGSRCPAV